MSRSAGLECIIAIGDMSVYLSVNPLHAGNASKLMTLGSYSVYQIRREWVKAVKNADFQPINSYVLEIIEDRHIVKMEDHYYGKSHIG